MTDPTDPVLAALLTTGLRAGEQAQAAGDLTTKILTEGEALLADIDARFDAVVTRLRTSLAEEAPLPLVSGARQPDILSENQAVEKMKGMGKAAARRLLRREGLSVVTVPAGEAGRKRAVRTVYWPDVLEWLRCRGDPTHSPAPAERRKPAGTAFGVTPGRLDTSETDGKQ